MKKIYTLLVLSLTLSMTSATVHIVSVTANTFTPNFILAETGDTIRWDWTSANGASTTSTNIPIGANPWDSGVQSTGYSFDYQVTVVGIYEYHCVNAPTTMIGNIEVILASEVGSINKNYFSIAYPNPFSDKLTVETNGADMISLSNVIGQQIKSINLIQGQTKAEINVSDLQNGIYFCSILKEGILMETRKMVKN